jgi:hypothetical protein
MYLNHCLTLTLQTPTNSKVYIDNLLRLRIVELGYDFSGEEEMTKDLLGLRMRRSVEA